MKVTGIIAEYNPFHKGHEYHIRKAKEVTGADYCVVIMSGDFVQRGAPALTDKYTRTRMALFCGADLVLELPTPYACSSAEIFADGAVRILNGLNSVDFLCFGNEALDTAVLSEDTPFLKLAHILSKETDEYQTALQAGLRSGLSFPKARNEALLTVYPSLLSQADFDLILNRPNNILGLEYCKALIRSGSSIRPAVVKRMGNEYHDTVLSPGSGFASASAIRESLKPSAALEPLNISDMTAVQQSLPESTYALLAKNWNQTCPVEPDDFSLLLHYVLLQHSHPGNGLTDFADVTSDLSDKILKNLPSYRSFSSFCETLKTKDLTASRISRSLLHILLQLTKEQMQTFCAPSFTGYARILGFRKEAAELLSQLKKQTSVPLISKPADAKRILGEGDAFSLFCAETYACDIYNAVTANKFGVSVKHEYTNSVILI